MKPQPLVCLLLALLLAGQGMTQSRKIYLSPAGSDNNPGTFDKPYATLMAARDKAREYRRKDKESQPIEIIAL